MSSVLTDRNDPDNIGFVQWRAAFYCGGAEGCLENFMALLDDFFVWKTKALAKDVEIHIKPHTSAPEITEDLLEGLAYEHYTHYAPASKLSLKLFQCQPVIGKWACASVSANPPDVYFLSVVVRDALKPRSLLRS